MEEERTREYYEVHAAEYAAITQHADLAGLWRLLTARLPRGSTILDVGCGSGRDLRYFAERGYKPTGIDLSGPLVRIAQQFSGQPVMEGDIRDLPFPKESFDAVWAIASLVHLRREEIPDALFELLRVLKPNGVFVASVKAGSGEGEDERGRMFTYFALDEWVDLLCQASFEVAVVETMAQPRGANGDPTEVQWIVSVCQKPGPLR